MGCFFYRLVYDRGKQGDAEKGVTVDLMDIKSQIFSIHADSGVYVCITCKICLLFIYDIHTPCVYT